MSLYQTCVEQVQANPLTSVGLALGGGVLLQRFVNLFNLVAKLFTPASTTKIDELRSDIAELVSDVSGGRLAEVLADLQETMNDVKDLLAAVKPPAPKV